ncbi:MAG: hypothetical protein JKY37_26830 [Nannocystaceae bacterium]|nr:hypothetical protein [Nannocystaceae bacterium]
MISATHVRILAILTAVVGCEASASRFGPGLDLQLRVTDAQLQRGVLARDEGGPTVSQVIRPQPQVRRGEATVNLSGRLGAGGVVLNIAARGDVDHWQIAGKGFDFVVSDELLWGAQLQFSHSITANSVPVLLQAVDEDGRAGPVEETSFAIIADTPPSQLLVSLGWDSPVDLDLHVQLPDGTVVGAKNVNAFEPPDGQVPAVDAWMAGGFIDFDSNQECRLDLRNRENVVWLQAPPTGTYRVYAHLFAPCDQPVVNASVVVQRGESVEQEVFATLYEFDSREHPSDGAPGLLMLEFDVE